MRQIWLILLLVPLIAAGSCRRAGNEFVTVALSDKITGLDTLSVSVAGASAERIRNLIFDSLVKKNESFDYVGDMAETIETLDGGTTVKFTLRDGIKFHNGKAFTSADVKYTFDTLFNSNGYKSKAFFDTVDKKQEPHILGIDTPDVKTVIFKIAKPSLRTQLLSNLVAIPIIPEGTAAQQNESPIGSGPFKFTVYDASQNTVDLEGFSEYWNGATSIKKLRVKTVTDASALQSELTTGGVDVAPNPNNLPPDVIASFESQGSLLVHKSPGSNVQYLGFNTSGAPLNNPKIRQAFGYAIDREKIIKQLLLDQATIANSVLPEASWAYIPGTVYTYDPAKARQLLAEANYKNEPIVFKYSSGNTAVNQYAQAIMANLADAGFNIRVEPLELATLLSQVAQGQFQMNTGIWIGGNQDPIFMRDLFTTGKIPGEGVSCCNRWRYKNPEVDRVLEDAYNEQDREKAKLLYQKAWELVSNDLPLMPLWYPSNIVVTNKRIGNIKISPSGDWTFIKDLTVQ